jgi:very-short-patch-repair endonuclease
LPRADAAILSIMPSTFARQLRGTPTDAEIRLWSRLRRKQLDGFRFRRQQPIGPYIVDFFCPEAKLVIEVDGGQHNVDEEKDEKRTRWLEERGYRVIRFWNNDVLSNTDGVVLTVFEELRSCRPPSLPSPSRGEGRIA